MSRSKLISLKVRNFGCIGAEGIEIALDNIVCLVGKNNCGKTTILKAYEYAQASRKLSIDEIYRHRLEGDATEVELLVHIPEGIYNIDAKWKFSDEKHGAFLVRSRWIWKSAGEDPIRQTWDPEINNWSLDEKAGGLDEVFGSRLPKPLRIDSLQDGQKEHEELMKLITDPVARELEALQRDKDSALHKAIGTVLEEANAPVARYQSDIDEISGQLDGGFKGIFPELGISVKVAMDRPSIEAAKLLVTGSSVRIKEGEAESFMKQQGTGSRRALFWSLLRVRNQLQRHKDVTTKNRKDLEKATAELVKEETKSKPREEKLLQLRRQIAELKDTSGGSEEAALPGHILLIDEPENALHPMAARAARHYLYSLSKDSGWQVMLTTHSPYFIDPLEDHTTIVRLEVTEGKMCPRTYRAENITYSPEEKDNLRALLQLDTALAEMFFGSYPIVVEGDTETAAFIAAAVEPVNSLSQQVVLIPSRGKGMIEPLIRLITHFGVSFGVLHDTDAPKREGGVNGMWTLNMKIEKAISIARSKGLKVLHRLSIPNFEHFLDIDEGDKNKPLLAYRAVKTDNDTKEDVNRLFADLYKGGEPKPFAYEDGGYELALAEEVTEWASTNRPDDDKYKVA